jgi:outer membrane immunogenic protein
MYKVALSLIRRDVFKFNKGTIMIKNIGTVFICLIMLSGIPAIAFAGADSGFYIGAGAGNATVKDNDFDESDSAYKLFGGYNFGVIPLVDLAVEASYTDFGKPGSSAGSIEVNSLNAFGLAGVSFGPVGIFAKAGASRWNADANFGTSTSDSGTGSAYGLGARFAIGSFGIRAEYEQFDLEADADVEMVSISGVYTF